MSASDDVLAYAKKALPAARASPPNIFFDRDSTRRFAARGITLATALAMDFGATLMADDNAAATQFSPVLTSYPQRLFYPPLSTAAVSVYAKNFRICGRDGSPTTQRPCCAR
jgi:hypothetical protein